MIGELIRVNQIDRVGHGWVPQRARHYTLYLRCICTSEPIGKRRARMMSADIARVKSAQIVRIMERLWKDYLPVQDMILCGNGYRCGKKPEYIGSA